VTPAILLAAALHALATVEVDVAADLDRAVVTHCSQADACRTQTIVFGAEDGALAQFGGDRLVSGIPGIGRLARPLELRFRLPAGVAVSAPGEPVDAARLRFAIGGHPGGWPAVVAFGRFTVTRVDVGGGQLDVAVLDGDPAPDVAKLTAWVAEAARDVTRVYGAFPVPHVQVVVTPVAGRSWRGRPPSREPVPFGRVLRDGGEGVQFFVQQASDAATLRNDWTATHEFSHLLLPYVARADGWLPEGFATYYQNVLLARAGVYDERDAWRRLVDGFARGDRQEYEDTLDESIAHEGENRLMRMYWSGVAVALLADVALRRKGLSLDAALAQLRPALPSRERWDARRVAAALDAVDGAGTVEALRARWTAAREFPDVSAALADLGVNHADGTIVLDDAAPLAAVRRAIMAPPCADHSGGDAQYTPASSPAASASPSSRQRASADSVGGPTTTTGACTSTKG
jgi:hypothetical protein